MIAHGRLKAPADHLGVLVEPAVLPALQPNALAACAAGDARIAGQPLAELRAGLRKRLDLTGSVIVTGHQVEFFHAGVFAKTIAADLIAAATHGQSVFLCVDSDVARHPTLAFPQRAAKAVQRRELPIPGHAANLPTAWDRPRPDGEWSMFFRELSAAEPEGGVSALAAFVDGWRAASGPADLSHGLARGQAGVERALGLEPARPSLTSELAETPEFRAFLTHLMLRARDFAECYNHAQQRYRARHRERSESRPVPPLAVSGERVELPFWLVRPGEPRRRLFVASESGQLSLGGDASTVADLRVVDLQREPQQALRHALAAGGWSIFPRALALTAFVRLFLADLFVHGLGGARYDEVTDDFVREFFGFSPAPILCVTATVHWGAPPQDSRMNATDMARRIRDFAFNPQRYSDRLPAAQLAERSRLIAEAEALRRERPADRPVRRAAFLKLRDVNTQLAAADPQALSRLRAQLVAAGQVAAEQRILTDREYFFALHPLDTLRALVDRLRATLTTR